MNIVILDAKTLTTGDLTFDDFKALGSLTVYPLTTPEQVKERIKDADAILCNKVILGKEEMDAALNLKYIGLFATGYNNVDIEYAKEKHIVVCNAGQYSTQAVTQHTFAFILEHFSKTRTYNEAVQQKAWMKSETFAPLLYQTGEITGKTLGLIGYGSIAQSVAKAALAFGMNVIVHTRTPKNDDMVRFVSFDELLEQSDVISAHCPLNEETKEMFNKEAFAKCKRKPYFINTARGGILVEEALAEAVKTGILSGAALDTLAVEPMRKDSPLLGVDEIVITPHVAWASYETRERLIGIVAGNLKAFMEGNPINVVNG